MIRGLFNWRTLLAAAGIVIVTATIFYSQYLARKIATDERQKVDLWVAASKSMLNNPGIDLTLPNLIRNGQQSIPIIETNEQDSIIDYINLDSARAAQDKGWLYRQLKRFRDENQRIEVKLSDTPYIANRYYYGHTALLDEVRYYPLVQLCLVAILIFFTLYSITVRNRSTQNQLWAGMAKETAHQLGTPVSSLEGWVEFLRESAVDGRTVAEIQKDVDRLKLVSDRFGKIGSKPVLEEKDLVGQVRNMMEYIRRRATGKVQFALQVGAAGGVGGGAVSGEAGVAVGGTAGGGSAGGPAGSGHPTGGTAGGVVDGPGNAGGGTAGGVAGRAGIAVGGSSVGGSSGSMGSTGNVGVGGGGSAGSADGGASGRSASPLYARISGPLFDWVIENLLKNALDAMEGRGSITVAISDHEKEIIIDVTDTGKGIAARNLQKVFKPGFTTKKRGWGLGLSLSKRIIEQYHKGQLFVRQSEVGKGTTFRIVLKK